MKIYAGSLPKGVNDAKLKELFVPFGSVDSATVITDRTSGESKGFGFVEMSNAAEAQAAINGLHSKEVDGQALTVNEARPPKDRGSKGPSRH